MLPVLVDTGVLVAALDRGDRHHRPCRASFEGLEASAFTVWPVLTEASHLLGGIRGGAQRLFEVIGEHGVEVLAQGPEDLPRILELMRKYADLPMDLADAALVRAAEVLRSDTILTTDKRDFRLYRPSHIRAFHILP